jgi:dephospho-CoA kinase
VVLTGGIGSGKSTVGRLLRSWGAYLVDADVLAREVVAPGTPGLAAVVEVFGPQVLSASGSLDRAVLADLVFDDPHQLKRLEEIVHPLVHRRAVSLLAGAGGAPVVVYEVPLPGRSPFGDDATVVVVDAPDDVRRHRLRDRGMIDAQVDARMASQPSRQGWLALADLVVDNAGSEADLRVEVARLWRALTGTEPPVGAGG